MSIKEGRDYIYLVWKEIETRRQYIVGQLSKNGQFEFKYGFEVKAAIEKGFKLLISFEQIDKVYKSDILFPVFSSRLPDKKRQGLDKILLKYSMKEYDEYKLLKRSGARLPIDNLEFIDPILGDDSEDIKRVFYMAGPRHYMGCDGEDCLKSEDIYVGEKLSLVLEPENKHDKSAIKILNSNDVHIGYIPRYYSETLIELINKKYKYNCVICDILKDNNCNECVKIELVINQ
ncbi:MAG: HIRAN domain-containing protein [Clostridium sp.]